MRLTAAAWFLIAFGAAPAGAPVEHATREKVSAALPHLDRLAAQVIAEGRVPGMAIAVVYRDEIVFLRGYGVRNVGRPESVDADTVFQIASLSKPIASTIVARLVGEGTLSWDARIRDVDPGFALYDAADTASVTVSPSRSSSRRSA